MTPEEVAAANAALAIGTLGAAKLDIVRPGTICKICGTSIHGEARRFYCGHVHSGCLDRDGLSPKGGA